jgi:hypothetical protein
MFAEIAISMNKGKCADCHIFMAILLLMRNFFHTDIIKSREHWWEVCCADGLKGLLLGNTKPTHDTTNDVSTKIGRCSCGDEL